MMAESNKRNIRLGAFVLTGTLLLILAFYLMGKNQNMFGSKFTLTTRFTDVGGLMKGNNVRYSGIDIGTVESVLIENDTSVLVTMVIANDALHYIRKNSIVSVGTDGLMGNKLVNIQSRGGSVPFVEDGDELASLEAVEMDAMVRTLNITNENIRVITENLRNITDKISNRNSLWNVLLDTIVAENVKTTIVNLKVMSNNVLAATGNFRQISADIKAGKGSIGALITDSLLSSNIKQSVVNLRQVSDSAAIITGDLSLIIRHIKSGRGSLGLLIQDTTLVHNLNSSIRSIDTGAVNFNENMEALQHSWPLKKYFKKKNSTKPGDKQK